MADVGGSIFNAKATEKLRSPDDLDKYLRVTNPAVWVILAACVALLAGLLSWGIFGAVTTSVSTTGVCLEGRAICLLDGESVAKVHKGDSATVGGEPLEVEDVAKLPVSRKEAQEVLGSDYLVSALMNGDWAYVVDFTGESEKSLEEGVPLTVTITVERVAPISLALGGGQS